mgnify:CR=1 FL=1
MKTTEMELPVIDLGPYLRSSGRLPDPHLFPASADPDPDAAAEPQTTFINGDADAHVSASLCSRVSASLRDYGALVVRDPRCHAQDSDKFLDMMEAFFQTPDLFKRQQERPLLHYQVTYFLPLYFISNPSHSLPYSPFPLSYFCVFICNLCHFLALSFSKFLYAKI